MPYVHIEVTDEGVTSAQKKALIKGTTDLLHQVLNKDPATTFVVIERCLWRIGVLADCPCLNFGRSKSSAQKKPRSAGLFVLCFQRFDARQGFAFHPLKEGTTCCGDIGEIVHHAGFGKGGHGVATPATETSLPCLVRSAT